LAEQVSFRIWKKVLAFDQPEACIMHDIEAPLMLAEDEGVARAMMAVNLNVNACQL